MKHRFSASLLALLLGTASLQALASTPMFYRYYDEKGSAHVDQRVTEDHLQYGYEELDSGMRPIRKVPPRPNAKDLERLHAEKLQRQADAERAREDEKLKKLYSGPKDAEMARDRQIDAIQLRIDFSNNSMARLKALRAQEAQKAAGFERNGKPVPKEVLANIAELDKKMTDVQSQIKTHRSEQDEVRSDFEPVIQRLHELTESKP